MATSNTVHTIGGVNLDKDPRAFQPNELSHAKDNDVFGDVAGRDASYAPLPSSKEAYDLPTIEAQLQYVRAKFDHTATAYGFSIIDASGNAIGPYPFSINVNPAWTAVDFVAAIDAVLSPFGFSAHLGSSSGVWFTLGIASGTATPIQYVLSEIEVISGASTSILIYTVQDAFNPVGAVAGQLRELQSAQVGNYQIVFSKTNDGLGGSIGYATPDDNGDWTYTSLVISNKLSFPDDQVIEIQIENSGNSQYGVYWIDNTGKPKVIYIPTSLGAFSVLKYNMTNFVTETDGLFSLESIATQTDLQIQNPARISFSEQIESGGGLSSGTDYYYVQVGIGRSFSEWSSASQPVPVFKAGTSSPSSGAIIRGDQTPMVTSKANRLYVQNVDPRIYTSVKIAALLNQDGGFSATIIGEYDVAESAFFVTHTGKESGVIDLDPASLPPVQDVIAKAKNVQLKKNRMNLANVELSVDEDVTDVFKDVVLGQVRHSLDSVGTVTYSNTSLFAVSVPPPSAYSSSAVGEQPIFFNTVDFNSGTNTPYSIPALLFTAPAAGVYSLQAFIDITPGTPSGFFSAIPTQLSDDFSVSYDAIAMSSFSIISNLQGALTSATPKKSGNLLRGGAIGGVYTLAAGEQVSFKAVFVRTGPAAGPYTVKQASFSGQQVGSGFPSSTIRAGEYQIPSNVANFTGYMVNESYPFFARLKYANGYLSSWYYLGTYKFNNGNGTSPAILTDGYLTQSAAAVNYKAYCYGLTVNGINVTGIKDRVVNIEIGRGVCNPTVLGTGMFIAADANNGGTTTGGFYTSGLYTGNTDIGTTYGNTHNSTDTNRYFGNFVCPDWMTGPVKPQYQTGDYLIVYGCNNLVGTSSSQILLGPNKLLGAFREFYGAFWPFSGAPTTINIVDGEYCAFNTPSKTLINDVANRSLLSQPTTTGLVEGLALENMALSLQTRINPIAGTTSSVDYGCYYAQYVRPNANQYDIKNIAIVPCGRFVDINSSSPNVLPQQQVFGGDTYTQKTYTKVMYNSRNPDNSYIANSRLSSFIGFYSQNKINQQLRFVDTTFTNQPFPMGNTLSNYLFPLIFAQEQFQIDNGYNWYAPINVGRAYNPKLPVRNKLKARIYYSLQKPLNAVQDFYRTILPNDFKDLAAKDGEIVGLYDTNDVMVAIQQYGVYILPYQSDVGLSAADGSLYVGNGGVYAQRENRVSTYGSALKSGTLKAENEAGNNQVYWYSNNAKALMRYGADGIKSLSNQDGWRTYFLNSTHFINSEFDIVMGYERNRRAIFVTARAFNDTVLPWDAATTYAVGNHVRYGAANQYKTFEQLQDIYVAKTISTNSTPYSHPADWEYIPTTDMTYYNYWSAIYNEKLNWFQGFFSLLPSRYFNFNGRIFVPRGIPEQNKVYDLFGGSTYLQWLSNGSTYKQGSFELEWVSTKRGLTPERFKWVGLQVGMNHNTATNPALTVNTETQVTTALPTDWDFRNGQLGVGIFPDASDEIIIGEYAKVRLTSAVFYRVYAMAVHLYDKARTILK